MTPLATAIQSEELSGSAAEVLDALLEEVVVSTDSTAYSWSGVNEKLLELGVAPEVVAGWDTALAEIPGGSMLDRMLASKGGVNLANPVIQSQLEAVKAVAAPEAATLLVALQAIGVRRGPRWSKYVEAEPDEAAVTAALTEVESREWWSHIMFDIVPSMLTAANTVEEIKAAIQDA